MNDDGFAHSLRHVNGGAYRHYYLTALQSWRHDAAEHSLTQCARVLHERAEGMSTHRGVHEAELVAAHVEMVSKELYAFMSRHPTDLPWSPTSAYTQLVASCQPADGSDTPDRRSPALQPSKTFSGTQLPCYRVHDELATVAELPMRRFVKPETWEYRQSTMREFLTPPRMAVAQQVVEHLLRTHRTPWSPTATDHTATDEGAATLASSGDVKEALASVEGFHQLSEDRFSFVHFGDGLFLHVWRVSSEARRLVSCAQKVWQTLFEHSMHPYGTLLTAVLFVKGVAVTFTQLPPLLPTDKVLSCDRSADTCAATAVAKALASLIGSSYYARSTGAEGDAEPTAAASLAQLPNPRLQVGADGRYYFMYPMSFGVFPEEIGGSSATLTTTSLGGTTRAALLATPLRLDWYHVVLPHGTSHGYTSQMILDGIRRGPCAAAADAILRAVLPKLTDMVTQQVVSSTLHSLGVNMRFLFMVRDQVMELASTYPPEAVQLAVDAIVAEMLCRSVKAVLRAELSLALSGSRLVDHDAHQNLSSRTTSSSVADDDAGGNNAAALLKRDVPTDRVNRFMQWCAKGDPILWDDQILPVLRSKFLGCPSTFHVHFHIKYFKIFTWYLTPRFGAAYDATSNAFSRLTQAGNPNSSFFFVPDVVKMHLSTQKSDEAALLIGTWWKAAEKLPVSTPLAWMERTLRMQRIASICVMMKHGSRLRFIDVCIGLLRSEDQPRHAVHHAMTALFQLMMMDEMDASYLVRHPLYDIIMRALRGLTAATTEAAWSDALGLPGALPSPSTEIENCHFLGYVLRSLGSNACAPVKTPSADDTALADHVRHAAVLQLRWNLLALHDGSSSDRASIGEGGMGRRASVAQQRSNRRRSSSSRCNTLDPVIAVPIDVCCNAQLLRDLMRLDDPRVRCALVCNLARYAAPLPFLALDRCNPAPTFISTFHDCVRGLWMEGVDMSSSRSSSSGEDGGGQHEVLCMRLRTAWVVLGDVCGVPTQRQSDTYQSLAGTAAEPTDPDVVYDDPHVVCSLMQCLACTLQLWMSNDAPHQKKDGFASLAPSQSTSIVLDAQALLALAYPAAAPASVSACGSHFTPDAVQDVNDAIRPPPFANALAMVLEDVLIPRQAWRLALAVGRFLQHNTTITRRESVDAALQSLALREAKAGVLQRRLRAFAARGRCAEAPYGSLEWHEAVRAKLDRLNRQAFLYAVGMTFEADQLWQSMARQEIVDRAQIVYWGVLLNQEVAWAELQSYRSQFEGARQAELLSSDEQKGRHAIAVVALETFAVDIGLASIDVAADVSIEALGALFAQQAAASSVDAAENTRRQCVFIEEADAWFSECVHAYFEDRYLVELADVFVDGNRETAMTCEIIQEAQLRASLGYEALLDAAEACLFAWCQVMAHQLEELVASGTTASQLMAVVQQEAAQREAVEADALVDAASGGAYAWLADCIAPALYAAWVRDVWVGGDDGGRRTDGPAASDEPEDSTPGHRSSWFMAHLVEPMMRAYSEAYVMELQQIVAHSEAELHGAALQMLINDEEPNHRRAVVASFESYGLACLSESAHLQRTALVEDESGAWCAAMDAEEQHRLVAAPELSQRRVLCDAAHAMFLDHVVVGQAEHRMGMVAMQWLVEAETVHRAAVQCMTWMRRPMLFSRPFVLTPERTTDVPRQEDTARTLLMQACATSALKALTMERFRTLRSTVELQSQDQRSLMQQEESATRLRWSTELNGRLLDVRIASVSAAEHKARWSVADIYTQDLRGWCLQWHRLNAEVLQRAYWSCDSGTGPALALLNVREAIFREDTRRKHATWMQGVAMQAAVSSFVATERAWQAAMGALEALMVLSTKTLRGRSKLEEEESTTRSTLLKLESLMQGIASNTFHAQHKTLLRPSQRALLSMQRRMHRHRQHGATSPPRPPLQPQPSGSNGFGSAVQGQQRLDMVAAMEATQRDHLHQLEERMRGTMASYSQQSNCTQGCDLDALERLLQTPPWDQPVNVLGSEMTGLQFSSVLLGSRGEATPVLDGTLGATPMEPLEPPVPFVSLVPRQEAPQDFLKCFRALVAAEMVARESTADDEKLARGFIFSDEREVARFFRDPVFLNYRSWIVVLPCMSHVYWASREDRELSKLDALLEHNCKKLVVQLRNMVRGMLETKASIARQEHTSAMLLFQRELLDRQTFLATGPKKGKHGLLRVGARGALLTPPKGGIPVNSSADHSAATSIAARRNPLLVDGDDVLRDSASLRGKAILASGSVESAALSLVGSSSMSPHGVIKSERDLMIEEWESRRGKAMGALRHVDDVAPSELRLRMRFEEVQQRCVMELLEHHRLVPYSGGGGAHVSPLQDRGGWHREKRSSSIDVAVSSPGQKALNPVDPKGRRRV